MKFSERNTLIDTATQRFKSLHDSFTRGTKILTDDEWNEYISSMDKVAGDYRDTNISGITGAICMAFLDDTEMVQKKLRGNDYGH